MKMVTDGQESLRGKVRGDSGHWPQLLWGMITRRTAANNRKSKLRMWHEMYPCLQIMNRNADVCICMAKKRKKKKKDWERYLLLLKLEGDIEFERYARRNYSGALSCMFFNILTFPFQKEVGSWGTTKISKCYILNKIYVFLFSPLALVERSSSVGMGHCGW